MAKLREKEKQFCYYIAKHKTLKEAAALSGYANPLIAGIKLYLSAPIKEYVQTLKNAGDKTEEVAAGLRSIAFGSIADAVKLATAKDLSDLDIDALDLQMVSELKFSKNGGVELKFFDRIKALEKLSEVSNDLSDESNFFEALQSSAARIEETGE